MDRKVISILLIAIITITACMCGCTQTAQKSEKTPIPTQTITGSAAAEKQSYIVGIDGEYPPYSFMDKNGTAQGFDVESIQWIGKEMGFDVKIQAIAWDGIIPALNAGKIDMVYSGMTITDERKEQVNFSKPYWKVNQSVATQNDNPLTFADFKAGKGRIGAQRGTTGAFWVEENLVNKSIIKADQLVTYDNFPLVATDLQNKRIDFAVYDRPPMLDAIADKPLHIIGEIDTGEEYGVAIRKSDAKLLETINTGLDKLMQSPKWAELQKKYEMA
ncbi:MAG TPA: basic amino acid ABC transporter substrate-binding protein [Methanospirillum sp.]|nr:basic amino acid ABC transporter substrate-binding protein [Methanospirillum sp.]